MGSIPDLEQWYRSQLWLRFNPLAWELPYAIGMALKLKKPQNPKPNKQRNETVPGIKPGGYDAKAQTASCHHALNFVETCLSDILIMTVKLLNL